MSTRVRVWIAVAVLAAIVGVYYPFSPAGRQASNMRLAERHIETLGPRLQNDPRFGDVRLSPSTADGGSLGVFGFVASRDDADSLKALIQQTAPPVETAFRVVVRPPASRPAVTQR